MKEDFLHFLWQTQRFDVKKLRTSSGEPLSIQHFGQPNTHAGPDFLNARICIGDTLWAGNVEMHLRSSDWYRHQHQTDPAYDTVILHVVLEEDQLVFRSDGTPIPCLVLKNRIPAKVQAIYHKLLSGTHWIPCQAHFPKVPALRRDLWLERIMIERLELKTEAIQQKLEASTNDWEEVFYQLIARNFGLKVNTEPFERLARSLPLKVLKRYLDRPQSIDAFLFGQAGLLHAGMKDPYPASLWQEYRFLSKKYDLHPLKPSEWKFFRLRPGSFPTIRIAQFGLFLTKHPRLFSYFLELPDVDAYRNAFALELKGYWEDHYKFDQLTKVMPKCLGASTIDSLIINTIVPFLFHFGRSKNQKELEDKALQLLDELPPEKNQIISGWKKLGMKPESALTTQALLHLKKCYCDQQKCLSCGIGASFLKELNDRMEGG